MAHDQIEYCGSCENYKACIELAKEGRLASCKLDNRVEAKHNEELS